MRRSIFTPKNARKKSKKRKKTRKHHGRLRAHPVSSKNTLVVYRAPGAIMLICVCSNARDFLRRWKNTALADMRRSISHPKSEEKRTQKKEHRFPTFFLSLFPLFLSFSFLFISYTALTYMRRSEFSHPKWQDKNTSKKNNTQAPRPFYCASRFKQEYATHVPCIRGYHVCLRLFERPGFSTSLEKHGSYLHSQVGFHTQNRKKKNI